MPHLSEMAKKYKGKATFTGVNVWETKNPKDNSYFAEVEKFVKNKGDLMAYNVALDGYQGTMAKTWMQAAGQNGIPASFVIDQQGRIAWIGHPMGGLDEVVGKVIAGTYDIQAEAAKAAKAQAAQAALAAAANTYIKPYEAGDYKGAVAAIDKLIADGTVPEAQLAMIRFTALAKSDQAAANDYARKLAAGVFKDNPMALNSLAWSMVDDQNPLPGLDFKVAIEVAEQCVAVTKDGDAMKAYNLDTLATAYAKDGQIDRAIATQDKALKAADTVKGFDPATRKEIAARLEQFKQKKTGGG